MEYLALILLGIAISVVGICNCLGYIGTIKACHRTRITEATRIPYGRGMGIATIIIGLSLLVAGILCWILGSETPSYIIPPALAIGVAIMICVQKKYNGGIF